MDNWKIQYDDKIIYKEPTYDDFNWLTIENNSLSEDTKFINSTNEKIIWYRKWIYLPKDKPLSSLGIVLGKINSADEVYINEHLIGKSGSVVPPYKEAFDKIRLYQIPMDYLIFGGNNLISIRVRKTLNNVNGMYYGNMYIGNYENISKKILSTDL